MKRHLKDTSKFKKMGKAKIQYLGMHVGIIKLLFKT